MFLHISYKFNYNKELTQSDNELMGVISRKYNVLLHAQNKAFYG